MKTILSSSSSTSAIILYYASLVESRNGQPDTDTLLTKFASSPYIMSDKIPTFSRTSEKDKDNEVRCAVHLTTSGKKQSCHSIRILQIHKHSNIKSQHILDVIRKQHKS